MDLQIIQNDSWNDRTASLFASWSQEFKVKERRNRRIYFVWKFITMLYIPISVLSFIFGATGLSTSANDKNNTQDIVLLSVGIATMILDRLKPRKYQLFYKDRANLCANIRRRIDYQLAQPVPLRKSPEELLRKLEIETKLLDVSISKLDGINSAEDSKDPEDPNDVVINMDN